jgi:hypothetical protein
MQKYNRGLGNPTIKTPRAWVGEGVKGHISYRRKSFHHID